MKIKIEYSQKFLSTYHSQKTIKLSTKKNMLGLISKNRFLLIRIYCRHLDLVFRLCKPDALFITDHFYGWQERRPFSEYIVHNWHLKRFYPENLEILIQMQQISHVPIQHIAFYYVNRISQKKWT
jgi:hypothetical protein